MYLNIFSFLLHLLPWEKQICVSNKGMQRQMRYAKPQGMYLENMCTLMTHSRPELYLFQKINIVYTLSSNTRSPL
jgi:hypothetical protein